MDDERIVIKRSPQGQWAAESPRVPILPNPSHFWGGQEWLGNPRLRYGSLVPSRHVSLQVKVEMLRDPVIAMASGFMGAMLVKCRRVVKCADSKKQRFFEAILRRWEREFILMANLAVSLGSCGLIKQYEFEKPQAVDAGAGPVWSGSVEPLVVTGFQQIHPMAATPRFDERGLHFQGIDGPEGPIDAFYSLWLTMGRVRAFGSYYGSGRLENVYKDWWMKQFARDLYLVSLQKEADRVVQVRYPPGQTDTGEQNRDIALAIGDSVRAGATVAVPSTVYQTYDSATGDERLSGVTKWAIEFMEGSSSFARFHEIDEHHDRKIALGYLLPPQAILDVTGGDLGGPTSADKLTTLAMEVLMLDAAEIDRHVTEYVFAPMDKINFPTGSPPVQIETVGLDTANQDYLFEVIKGLLSDPESKHGRMLDVTAALEQLRFPTRDPKEVEAEMDKEKREAEAEQKKAESEQSKAAQAQPGVKQEQAAPGSNEKPDEKPEPTEAIAGSGFSLSDAERDALQRRLGGELPPIPYVEIGEADARSAWEELLRIVPELAL